MNPFPLHRPSEDPRAARPERLASPGAGDTKTSSKRPPFGALMALTVGIGVPVAAVTLIVGGLPLAWRLAVVAGFGCLATLWVLRSRGLRSRADQRARLRRDRRRVAR